MARLTLVAPALDGPATGGTLYNRQLVAALRACGTQIDCCALADLSEPTSEQIWVDSLYLAELRGLRAHLPQSLPVGLLLHYLPSLLTQPALQRPEQLSAAERDALRHAGHVIVPSAWLEGLLTALAPDTPCSRALPGLSVTQLGGGAQRDGSALMICNVTANKGVLPLLEALAAAARGRAGFALQIAGRLDLEPDYAVACQRLCAGDPWLRAHVTFLGGLTQSQLFERMARSSVCVSASRVESYGMALAEARAHGTPLLACAGGNVAHHVAADSGGELLPDPPALARALLDLMQDGSELARRAERARSWALAQPARSWRDTAQDFLRASARLAQRTR